MTGPVLASALDPSARYRIVDEIASGGMGSVFLALQTGTEGRPKPVAIKKLHAHLAEDSSTVDAFVDEARIAFRLRHPNVVRVHDVVPIDGQLVIVMEWIEGIALRSIARRAESQKDAKSDDKLPIPVIRRILIDALEGLHAAHELKDDRGTPLDIVHRDISPQNLLVGTDGLTRVTDFGIALARGRLAPTTVQGGVKGKIPYLSPEQVNRGKVDRRSDIFAAGVVAWELLAGKRLFTAPSEGEIMAMILREPLVPPSSERLDVPLDLDETVLRALERKAERRFQTAAELAKAIEEGGPVASHEDVGRLVVAASGSSLAARRQKLAQAMERPEVRTLQEEMTATFNVPTVKQTRTSIPASARASRASMPPRVSIHPVASARGRITIDPTGVAASVPPPSMRPVSAQRSTTTLALVAAVATLLLAIVVVLKYRGNDDVPTKTSFPPPPVVPAADPNDPRLAPAPAPFPAAEPAPFQNPIVIAPIPAPFDVAPPAAPQPAPRPAHRPRRDAGAGKQGKTFMPDDL